MTNRHRCAWAEDDPLMRAYHDEEWGVPQRDSRMLWEMLMLEGFQAGLAWITVLRKREAFRKAFAGFRPRTISRFGEARVLRLMADAGIIRARAKIEATIRGNGGPGRALQRLLLVIHARSSRQGWRSQVDRILTSVGADLQGHEAAWLQVRRANHCLCLDAGRRYRQRPFDRLLPARSTPRS